MVLHVDFETRSELNLLEVGAHRYARHPSTEVLMMSWAFDDEPVQLWVPSPAQVVVNASRWYTNFPKPVREHIETGGRIDAFNAQFERLIFWYIVCPDFDVPEPKLEQFYCTAAECRANNMPGNLFDACRMAGAEQWKKPGKDYIKLFSIPRADGEFNDASTHPVEWAEFCDYCVQDTEAERGLSGYMRPMRDWELQDYHVNERINDAGLMIDRDLAAAAQRYADDEQHNLIERITELTGGACQKARGTTLTKWVYQHIHEDHRPHMHVYKKGELRLTFDKEARARLLDEELEPDIAEVIECSDFAQAASTGKYKAMELRADVEDDRVRGSYLLNGAAGTGRYSARGLQPHNMPRKGYPEGHIDCIRQAFCDGLPADHVTNISRDNIMQTLKGLLRYSIRARDGHTFVCGDWSQIEGRVNPWLADSKAGRRKLEAYADPTRDVYLETASAIVGETITDPDDPRRQGYGKVPELALGFGGGVPAFAAMARGYGVRLEREVIEKVVARWRRTNTWAQPWWQQLFDAALKAYGAPGEVFHAGRVAYTFQSDFLGGTLWCLLPSGRLLQYPQMRAEWTENKFGNYAWQLSYAKSAWKPKADESKWPRAYLWPGLLCENVTQAVAADVLREFLRDVMFFAEDPADLWPIVGHTHDEALLEVPLDEAEGWAEELRGAMVSNPEWAEGLPLDAEVWIGPRYKK